jgi:hypothetical protein
MQFRFSTEVNEGNKDVSGFLKSPSLPLFPSVFPPGLEGNHGFETHSSPDSLGATRRAFTLYLGNPVSSIETHSSPD